MPTQDLDPQTRTELEAATFRRLVQHLRERTDVQNIDMMNLAGFCRNCLIPTAVDPPYGSTAVGMSLGFARGRPTIPARDRLRHAL